MIIIKDLPNVFSVYEDSFFVFTEALESATLTIEVDGVGYDFNIIGIENRFEINFRKIFRTFFREINIEYNYSSISIKTDENISKKVKVSVLTYEKEVLLTTATPSFFQKDYLEQDYLTEWNYDILRNPTYPYDYHFDYGQNYGFPLFKGYPFSRFFLEGKELKYEILQTYYEDNSGYTPYRTCSDGFYLSWANSVGGVNYWLFRGQKVKHNIGAKKKDYSTKDSLIEFKELTEGIELWEKDRKENELYFSSLIKSNAILLYKGSAYNFKGWQRVKIATNSYSSYLEDRNFFISFRLQFFNTPSF